MNDDALSNVWTTLELTRDRRRRIDARVSAWLDARDTTLAAEWLGLFRLAPLPALGLTTVSAVVLLLSPPLGWFVRAVM